MHAVGCVITTYFAAFFAGAFLYQNNFDNRRAFGVYVVARCEDNGRLGYLYEKGQLNKNLC